MFFRKKKKVMKGIKWLEEELSEALEEIAALKEKIEELEFALDNKRGIE